MMPPSISVSYNMARRPLQSERAATYFFLAGAAAGAGAATPLNISTT